MSTSDVTRSGVRGERPGRDAAVAAAGFNADRQPERRPEGTGQEGSRQQGSRQYGRRKGRGEALMVPKAEFTSYYGRPIIKPPSWEPLDIAGYFFLGGLAGAGSTAAAAAQLTGRPATARALKLSSLVAISGSAAALVHDLGRPGRFANMLRVFKPTSPMSVGSWLLTAYGPAAGAAAVLDVTGRLPRIGRAATAAAGLVGPAVAAYTAVLAADTAVPAWHEGYRELPFVFVGSAAAAAAGLALVAAPTAETGPIRAVALGGAALEMTAAKAMQSRMGVVAENYESGKAGTLMRAAELLTVAGGAGAALFAKRSRLAAALCGTALLAGSACTRFGVFHAGVQSAKDPKYTVVPQRERKAARAEPHQSSTTPDQAASSPDASAAS